MKRHILAIALAAGIGVAGLAPAGFAQDVPGETAQTGIRGVISGQIAAFGADDFATAFDYASPAIKSIFGTAETFGRMVREGYPMVWRPGSVEFAALTRRGGKTYQTVLIRDRDGALHVLDYEMIETPDGWQINGVTFSKPGAVGA